MSQVDKIREMSDDLARKRLKKKVLDRWENEGGRILIGSTTADDQSPTRDHAGEGSHPSPQNETSTVGTLTPLKKQRKLNGK